MKDIIKKFLKETLVLKVDKIDNQIVVQSDETDIKKASQETFKNKTALKQANFAWNGNLKAWTIPADQFAHARQTLEAINKKEMFIDNIEQLAEFVHQSEDIGSSGNISDKLKMYVQDLANIVDEAAMSAEIRRYLTFFAKFKGHSFYNTILIWIQRPDATRVAGFNQWEKLHGRKVKKGAKGIQIFAPIFRKGGADSKAGEVGDDKGLDKEIDKGSPVHFRPVYVFDISDTEAIDDRGEIPEMPEWFSQSEPTELTERLYTYAVEMAEDMGINITNDASRGGERGSSRGDHINMVSSVKGAGEFATLVHEMAHELMHWKKSSIYFQGDAIRSSKGLEELQAESVAYVVMKHYDLPAKHSAQYIALWKGNKEAIHSQLKAISDVGRFIINGIDTIAHATETANKKQNVA